MLEGGGGPPVSDIVRSDWLDVQSRVLRLWERRWVILEQNRLLVYRPPTIKDAAVGHGRLVLELRCDKVFNIQGPLTEAHVLYLQTGPYSGYKLKCHTLERATDWKRDILYRACKKDK